MVIELKREVSIEELLPFVGKDGQRYQTEVGKLVADLMYDCAQEAPHGLPFTGITQRLWEIVIADRREEELVPLPPPKHSLLNRLATQYQPVKILMS